MLVSFSKIFVILVVAQYVTSVEFYKSKRVPPKYKEIRRTYSFKRKEENVDSKPAETLLEKDLDHGTFTGNVEITDIKQPNLTTSTVNNNKEIIDVPLKKEFENVKTEYIEAEVNQNSDQNKESIDDMETTKEEPNLTTTTIKPKRRPFNLRKISQSSEININESDDRDKVLIGRVQTINRKQFHVTTSTTAAKRFNYNIRPLSSKGVTVQNKPVEVIVKEDVDEVKEPIDDMQITEEKKPLLTTIKSNRRFSNFRLLKSSGEKVQSTPAKTIVSANADQDKASNGNLQTMKEDTPVLTNSKIKPLRRTFNSSLKRKKEGTNDGKSKLVSSENVETTENKKIIVSSSAIKPKIPTALILRNTFKKKEIDGENESVETIVKEDADQEIVSNDDIQIIKDKKPIAITSTIQSKSSNSSLYSLKREEGNTDDFISSANVQTIENKNVVVTSSKDKAKIPSIFSLRSTLKMKEEEGDNESNKTIANEDGEKDKVSNGNIEIIGSKKYTVITSAPKPKTSTSNPLSSKGKDKNTDGEYVEPVLKEKAEPLAIDNTQISNKKISVSTSSVKLPLKKKEDNSDSEYTERIVNENISQFKVSDSLDNVKSSAISAKSKSSVSSSYSVKEETEGKTIVEENAGQTKESLDTVKITGDNKLSAITSTVRPITSILKVNAFNKETSGESVGTIAIVNDGIGQTKVSIGNTKVTEVSTSTIKPRRRTLNLHSLKMKGDNSDSKPVVTLGNEKFDRDQVVTKSTGVKKLRVTSSVIKPQRRTLNINSLKKKEENTSNQTIETLVSENIHQEKVSTGDVKNTGDMKFSLISRTIQPQRRTSNLDSSKKKDENTSNQTIEALVSEHIQQEKASTADVLNAENKKFSFNSRTVTPQRRISNLNSLKKKVENTSSQSIERLVSENIQQEKASTADVLNAENKKFSFNSRTVTPQRRISNLNSLKKKEENTSNHSIERLVTENIQQENVSAGDVQNTGNLMLGVISRTIKPQRRTSNHNSLKKKEENTSSQTIEAVVSENIQPEKASTADVLNVENKKLSLISRTIQPQRRTSNLNYLKKKEENTRSQSIEELVSENIQQEKMSTENVQNSGNLKFSPISRTIKPQRRTSNLNSLKKKEENTSSQTIEALVSEHIQQEKASTADVLNAENEKFSLISSTITPQRRTSNPNSLKNKVENTSSQSMERLISENMKQEKASTADVLNAGNKKFSLISSIVTPLRGTLNLNSSKKREENISSKQDKASIEDEQNTEDKKFSLISSTIKTQRRTLNIDSLKINEANPNSESADTLISSNFDNKQISTDNIHSKYATTEATSYLSTEEPKVLTANSVISGHGNNRIIKTQRKILVQNSRLDAESNPSTVSTISNNNRYVKVVSEQAPRSDGKYYQTSTPHTQLQKTTQKSENFVPIVGVQNYVYAYNGDYHYSYEGGDGTKAFERGELKSADGSSNSSGVVGGYSYKDKDGNDFNLSYTAGEGGYQPVGAHLPTPPPIPPAIQRVLRILATKTTPEPVTERIKIDHRN